MRRFPPLAADHPLVGTECPACHERLSTGDSTTLVLLGPGADPDERQRAREGRAHNAVGAPVHWACATGDESEWAPGELQEAYGK